MVLGLTQSLIEMSAGNISWEVNSAGAWGWQPYQHPVLLSCNVTSQLVRDVRILRILNVGVNGNEWTRLDPGYITKVKCFSIPTEWTEGWDDTKCNLHTYGTREKCHALRGIESVPRWPIP
jgi:hypothetical protein